MSERNYSLTVSTKDGPLTAPRWVHYVIRILIGVLLAAPFMRVGWSPDFAWVPGTVLVIIVGRAGIVWKGWLPVGFERSPFPMKFDDVMLDFSLNMMLMPIAEVIAHPTLVEAVIALLVEIVLIAGFLDRYPDPSQ